MAFSFDVFNNFLIFFPLQKLELVWQLLGAFSYFLE